MNIFLDSFSKDALHAHNKYRAMHQVPSLKWSRGLAKEAEAWAHKLAEENCLRNGDTDDGENLYAISGKTDLTGEEIVDKWYDGIKNYRFHRPGFQSDAGHFTQIVWKNTNEVGVGKAKTSDGRLFVVARYRPAGNVVNRFEQNVLPAQKSESPKSTSKSHGYKSRVEERNGSEPVIRTERSYERRSEPDRDQRFSDRSRFDRDRRGDRDDFSRDFEDMRIDRNGTRGGTKTETVTYNDGPGRTTVITKTYTSGDGSPNGVRTVRETRTINSSDDDFGGRRGRKWDEDDDFFRNSRGDSDHKPRWGGRGDKSPQDTRSASAPKSSTKIDKSFKDQCISSHNKYRAMHSASPLKWNDDIAKQAQWYAEKLARARSLQHSSKSERGDVGENLAMFTGDYDNAGERASDMWYEEVKNYNFSRKCYQGGCGHFTQLVWKGSKELGMGRAKTPDGRSTYVVARYRPAGNIVSQMDENVSRR